MDRTAAAVKRSIAPALLVGTLALTSCATSQDAVRTAQVPAASGPTTVAATVPSTPAPAPAATGYTDETRYLGTTSPATGGSVSQPGTTTVAGTTGLTVAPTSNVSSSVTGTVINPAGAVVPSEPTVGATPITDSTGVQARVAGGSNTISTTPAVSVDLAPTSGSSPRSNAAGSSVPATRAERPVTIASPTRAAVPPPAGAAAATSSVSSSTTSSNTAAGEVATSGGSGGVSISQRADGSVAVTNSTATAPAKPTARQRMRSLFRRRPPTTTTAPATKP
ncbi:MAG TPA: hypothetical protein VNM92_12230 [Thermoanaerobaculia bacterium]|nr:hypothetical protein [Thermoanaerobaculia bacterium]